MVYQIRLRYSPDYKLNKVVKTIVARGAYRVICAGSSPVTPTILYLRSAKGKAQWLIPTQSRFKSQSQDQIIKFNRL